ncbi:MAG: flagellar filament capping protein FliD [Phycisphaerae bacterium]|nr:flagellar filament capping protein FliD [Phycisphaerae bacterium]
MASIQLSGLLSGIDTKTIVSQLIAVEKRSLLVYQNRKSVWEEKQQALGELETKLTNLRNASNSLSDSGELRSFKITSSDSDKVTADASNSAYEGNHTVVVEQLANAERWVHSAGVEYAEDYVGAGTFVYSYNHKETTLTTTATTTLQDLVGLINNDANNPGVTAGVLYYNKAYHLVLNGNDAGSDYAISVNASSTEVWQSGSELTYNDANAALSTRITDLEQFGSNSLEGTETIVISGTDHSGVAITPVTINLTSNTKISNLIGEINDAFDGTAKARFENGKITLVDDTCGTSGLSVGLTYNANGSAATLTLPDMAVLTEGGATTADLADFAGADFTQTQAAQNSKIKVNGYPTGVEEWIERSSNTIDDVISGVTLHLHDTTESTGEQITLTRDIQSVKDKINALVLAYNSAVQVIKDNTKYDEQTKTAGVLMSDYTVKSIQYQIRQPLIEKTAGFVKDIDEFLSPTAIGLTLDRDGMLNFDTNTFDEAIAKDYRGVLAVIGADKTGSSTSETVKFYNASDTYTTAGEYDVQVTVSGGAVTIAKIKLSGESVWRDMQVNGNILTGTSSFDTNGNPVYAENGLQLSVDLGSDGAFTSTVRVKQGFTGKINDRTGVMLKATVGSMEIDQKQVTEQIKQLDDKITQEETRLSKREERLTAKYARLEKTLSLLQNQLAALGISSSSS